MRLSQIPLLDESYFGAVRDFVKESGILPTEFGKQAVGDSSFIRRLSVGTNVRKSKINRSICFAQGFEAAMASYPKSVNLHLLAGGQDSVEHAAAWLRGWEAFHGLRDRRERMAS